MKVTKSDKEMRAFSLRTESEESENLSIEEEERKWELCRPSWTEFVHDNIILEFLKLLHVVTFY